MRKGSTNIWTEDNVAKLRELYPMKPLHEIADVIECSVGSVFLKSKQLGLTRAPTYNPYSYRCRYLRR